MNLPNDQLEHQAFPVLSEAQIALLRPFGDERRTQAGDVRSGSAK